MNFRLSFLTLILTVCLMVSGVSQPYSLIRSNTVSLYQNSYNDLIYAIRIDSTEEFNGDSVLYNYKQFRIDEPNQLNETIFYSDTSWIGLPVLKQAWGKFIFRNRNGDSILIHSNPSVGQKWPLFQDESWYYIQGEYIGVKAMDFWGVQDSVRAIQFNVIDTNGQLISHPMQGKRLYITASLGCANLFNFYNFPNDPTEFFLLGIANPLLGVQPASAINFLLHTGVEEFQVHEYSLEFPAPIFLRDLRTKYRVIISTSNSTMDTVFNTFEKKHVRISNANGNPYPDTVTSWTIINNKLPVSSFSHLNLLPFQMYSNYGQPCECGYVYAYYSGQCIKGWIQYVSNYYDCQPNGKCHLLLVDPYYVIGYSVENLGYGYHDTDPLYFNKLRYVKHTNGNTCGSPLNINNFFTGIEGNDTGNKMYLNTQFNGNELVLHLTGISIADLTKIEIFDINGRQIMAGELLIPGIATFNISEVPTGIYLISANNGESRLIQKIFIVK